MFINTRAVDYQHEGEPFEGLLITAGGGETPRPVILVLHDWHGRSAPLDGVARKMVEWGYSAFAVDLFGKGKRGKTTEECQALMMPFLKDRALLRKRLLNAVEVVRQRPEIDPAQLAAIGFCFGGLCALDLARAGAPLKAVACFHGLFTPPGLPVATPMHAKVIAFHGWQDPFAPPDQVLAFGKEFSDAGADWQLHAYGGTKHAFMMEGANNPAMGLLYNEHAARRAWAGLKAFLAEVFGAS